MCIAVGWGDDVAHLELTANLDSAMLLPDILTPPPSLRDLPAAAERRLQRAVLADAIGIVRGVRGGGRYFPQAHAQLAAEREWFTSRRADWPFSFEAICAANGLNADAVRRALGIV